MVLMPHDVKYCLGHGFLLSGLTPSVDGRPSVSRRWAAEVFPRSWQLSSVSSEISRTSPTVLRLAAANTGRMGAGHSTFWSGVAAVSPGVEPILFVSLAALSLPS